MSHDAESGPHAWTFGGIDRYGPTEGHHVGHCAQLHGADPRSAGARVDIDGFPVQAGWC